MSTSPLQPNVAALDDMLRAIGHWQADPRPETWQRKLQALKAYLVAAEKWEPHYLASAVGQIARQPRV